MATIQAVCPNCRRELTKRRMTVHLRSCLGEGDATHLVVEAYGMPEYWLHLAVPARATLYDVDALLRRTWLERCGHLSGFDVKGVHYASTGPVDDGWGPPTRSMDTPVARALPVGTKFTYDYDYGSTTRLVGRAVGSIAHLGAGVAIIAQNDSIAWTCRKCEAGATGICPSCGDFSCDACAELACSCKQRWSDPLPVVDSPRMGVCGYSG